MNVYVVLHENLDSAELVSVHSSQEGADAAAASHRQRYFGGVSVEEIEVQP